MALSVHVLFRASSAVYAVATCHLQDDCMQEKWTYTIHLPHNTSFLSYCTEFKTFPIDV